MTEDEYRLVVRNLACAVLVAILMGGTGFFVSYLGYTKFLGALPSLLFGFFFGLVLGNKFFPDAGKFATIRCRNYRRQKAGKKLIDDEDPDSEYYNDIGRG